MRFSNYYNREGRNRNIYSRKNILGMTMKEMLERELELAYQYNTIGIPADQELLNSEFAHQYMDEQGNSRWQAGKQEFPAQPTLTQNTVSNVQHPQPQTSGMLEGFGQSETKGLGGVQKKNEFPDLGKAQNLVSQNNPMTSPVVADVKPFVKEQKSLGSYGNLVQSDLSEDINLDENFEEITEEPYLNYEDLLPDEIEEERKTRETAKLEVFNKALDKANGVEDESDENDILSYEDMLRLDSDEDSVEDDYKLETLLKKIPTDKLEDFLQKFKKEELASDVKQNSPREKILKKEILQNAKPEILEENIGKEEIGFLTGAAAGVDKQKLPNKLYKRLDLSESLRKASSYLQNKIKKDWDILVNNTTDYRQQITPKEKIIDFAIKNPITKSQYPISSNLYADARESFNRAKKNPHAKILDNIFSLDKISQKYLKQYGVKDSDRGVLYDENSEISELFANSPEIKSFLIKNKDAIKQGKIKDVNLNFEASLKDAILNKRKFDRLNSIQHAKLYNIGYDESNNTFVSSLGDRFDYNRRNPTELKDITKTFLNNFGYNMQEKGNLENYFTQIELRTRDIDSAETLKEYLEEEKRKKKKKSR